MSNCNIHTGPILNKPAIILSEDGRGLSYYFVCILLFCSFICKT